MAKILLTGGTGFIGSRLAPVLRMRGHTVVEANRIAKPASNTVAVGEIGPDTDWSQALEGADTVVHLAAIAHRAERNQGGDAAFRRVNDEGTRRLAESAKSAGVRTFVHMSSIFAREFEAGRAPEGPYGESKLAAEQHVLHFIGRERSAVILRPPLVYGSNAKANWAALTRLAATRLPLPFGAISNRRSVISVNNLAHAMATILGAAGAPNGVYEIADGPPVSLREILTWLRQGMGHAPRLVGVSPKVFHALAHLGSLEKPIRSLVGDLVVDPGKFMADFAWVPPQNTRDAIIECGKFENDRLQAN